MLGERAVVKVVFLRGAGLRLHCTVVMSFGQRLPAEWNDYAEKDELREAKKLTWLDQMCFSSDTLNCTTTLSQLCGGIKKKKFALQ